MDALELLLNRTSCPALQAPAPTDEQLEVMMKAASRAPDHGSLTPYRFLRVQDEGLSKLGELFLSASQTEAGELSDAQSTKLLNMPKRAPMILVAIACTQEHPKVPVSEQVITAGCAAHSVVQAASALGLGAMWRSGDMAFNPEVAKGLGLADNEQIIGFIYLGQALKEKTVPEADTSRLLSDWPN
ncbi:Nitroreductase family protein [Marinobacterium lacunae]|uniref:Putative NAD(P)H nitroreductase n=1 Tax=Marinobacterium lacunae TaxID=1232683 RepID=A0A081FZP7_9GAMM|nr:nitroreductase family protein [Marinobacterium lacunae]KEA64002.1 Nitroreductase family protein [Marinobacterium lacunae]